MFASKKFLQAFAIVGLAVAGLGSTSASACEVHYQKVVTYVTKVEKCVETVIKYDECHRPYEVTVVTYKTVKVPVVRYVKVCD